MDQPQFCCQPNVDKVQTLFTATGMKAKVALSWVWGFLGVLPSSASVESYLCLRSW